MIKPSSEYICQVKAEVLPEADVVVAGGGTAGVVAALAAARNGARTVLVERYGHLGGMLTHGNAGITMFTKFSGKPEEHEADLEALKDHPEELHIAGGITMEIAERLLAEGIGIGNSGTVGSYIFTSSEDFKCMLFKMMKDAGVRLRLHSMVVDVVKDDGKITGIVLESKSGRQVLPAKQFIDTSGDGDVAARAGVPYTVGVTEQDVCASQAKIGEMHPVGVMFKAGNVDLKRTFDWLSEHPEHYKKQPFARFTFEEARERLKENEMATIDVIRDGEVPARFQIYNLPTPGVVTLCCPQIKNMDGCDVEELTRAEEIMSSMLGRWFDSIKKVPGFENSYLLQIPEMGVRETRHIQGEYILNLMDIYEQKDFEDCIGLGSHPIDTRPRPEWLNDPETSYPPRWYFQIPFRSLIAQRYENLLIAGRCISATHEAFGCIRPTVQCMITGEAAGTAAAMCVRDNINVRELDYRSLRNTLTEQGVKCLNNQGEESCLQESVTE